MDTDLAIFRRVSLRGRMYFHIFGFQWKPEATAAQKAQVVADVKAFYGVIEGLEEVHVGENESPRGRGYAFAVVMRFTEKAAFEAYMAHPVHQKLVDWLMPLIEPVELDFSPLD